jgi:SpoVK/Ycf46/Vps4 family AAA+-type ATPase
LREGAVNDDACRSRSMRTCVHSSQLQFTTNSGGSIDPAFKRRLSFRLSFPFPDEDTRAELWRAHLPRELPRAGERTSATA